MSPYLNNSKRPVVIRLTLNALVLLQLLSARITCFNKKDFNPARTEKSKLMSARQSNQDKSVISVRRTGPCWYRTLSSQTPLVGLPDLPICNKLHASFSETVKYWRHSSPLGISSLFATLQSGFGCNFCLLHTRTQLDS